MSSFDDVIMLFFGIVPMGTGHSCYSVVNDNRAHEGITENNNFSLQHGSIWHDITLHWRQNERERVSNHQPHDCLLNCLFRCRSKKTSKVDIEMPSYRYRKSHFNEKSLSSLQGNLDTCHYRNSHHKGKMVSWPSYPYNVYPVPGKTVFILRHGPDFELTIPTL